MKKTISLFLAILMAFSCFGILASAKAENAYTANYDTDTPVVVLHGIGQNNTYVLDDEGNRKTDGQGDYITGWPLEINVGALVARILPNLFFFFIQKIYFEIIYKFFI